ncbi:MAG: glycosyl transferase [Candidatus Peregrinibacteria bacterium GW2011_GWF2_38_29]|nr:MAG: glycosyl transferase [Candidatus Peregrinibacteria bacterium GW2011_GWF2_38_29]HBB03203.1 hypothetical protein [Candidatus Peregrinibacteria bacterium]
MNFPKVSIVMINYNGLQDTIECLGSLKKCVYPNFEILLIDNGSEESQSKAIFEFKMEKLRTFISKENLGFAGGNNFVVRYVLKENKSDYIYFLNNDTIVEPDFLNKAVEAAEKDLKIGVVAGLSLQYANRHLIENAGHDFLNCGDFVPRGRGFKREELNGRCEILGACGADSLYRVETLKQCGLFDESFFLNYEDADLSMRCILYGWKCVYEPKSIIYHKVNASIKKVRNYAYALRSQGNLLKAYFYNTPALVLLLNMPFFIFRDISVILTNLIFLKFEIVRLFLHSRFVFLRNLKAILKERRARMKHKHVSSWYILRKQKFFLKKYFRYFVEIILKGRGSALQGRVKI